MLMKGARNEYKPKICVANLISMQKERWNEVATYGLPCDPKDDDY